MYDNALGRWFNVDPLAEKRYGYSTYNYVSNNPITRIDPDGMLDDGYVVDYWGYFTWVSSIGGDEFDVIYSWKGFLFSLLNSYFGLGLPEDSITISSEFMKSHKRSNLSDYYAVSDEAEGRKIFEFLANNTIVEWNNTLFSNKNGETMNGIMTSHLEGRIFNWGYMQLTAATNGYDWVLRDDHNHPTGGFKPSDADRNSVLNMKQSRFILPNTSYRIFFNGKYYKYNEFGLMED